MESLKHKIISTEVIYVWEKLQIIVSICESLVKDTVFFCFTRRMKAANYDLYFPREIARKLLLELPGALNFAKTLPKVNRDNCTGGWYTEVTKRLLASNDKKEYYIGVKQSNVYGSYYICLTRRNLSVHPFKDTDFYLTLPGAQALLNRLPHALLAADTHQEMRFLKEPVTIPLESAKTEVVYIF